jgi:hypothetical protein
MAAQATQQRVLQDSVDVVKLIRIRTKILLLIALTDARQIIPKLLQVGADVEFQRQTVMQTVLPTV